MKGGKGKKLEKLGSKLASFSDEDPRLLLSCT
jgi:hypothetical protein